MIGVSLFLHAISMILNNLGAALRISAGPMLLQLVLVLALGTGFVLTGEDMTLRFQRGEVPLFGAFVTILSLIVLSLWVAVAWHRFILREETPAGALPAFNGGAIWAYLVAGAIFVLILMLVSVPFGLIGGLIVAPMAMAAGGEPGLFAGFLLFALVYLPVSYVAYRISPILPSAALQARMPLKEAWYATGTSGAAFVVLTVVTVLAAWLLNAPAQYLPGILAVIWAFLANWITVMVGASILTTIYGHYVEGRALNA